MAARRTARDSGDRIEIDTRYAAERWPYICPRGHIDWRATKDGFVCEGCGEENGAEAFPALRDRRSGEQIPREQVRVVETAVAAAYETDSKAGEASGRIEQDPER